MKTSMEVIVIETDAFERLHRDLMQQVRQAVREAKEEALANADPANDWLSIAEAKELLGVRSKTKMQELRDSGEIQFTKHGRIIRYSKRSILAYLEGNIPKW